MRRGLVNPSEYRLDDMQRDIDTDLAIWKQLQGIVRDLQSQPDHKLLVLSKKLKEIMVENSNKSLEAPPTKIIFFHIFVTLEIIFMKSFLYYIPNASIDFITGATSSETTHR